MTIVGKDVIKGGIKVTLMWRAEMENNKEMLSKVGSPTAIILQQISYIIIATLPTSIPRTSPTKIPTLLT